VQLYEKKYLATIIIVLASVLAIPTTFANTEPAQAAVGHSDKPVSQLTLIQKISVKSIAIPQSREYRASKSKDTKDMNGFEPSLYRGIWYTNNVSEERRCIMRRESNFTYYGMNKTSSARGAYQFLDNKWRDGLVYMFIKESKKTDDGLIKEARKLFDKPIHKWNRYWQDRAFFTAWRFGEGRKHWYHGYGRCN
jgi:hypothetical protein